MYFQVPTLMVPLSSAMMVMMPSSTSGFVPLCLGEQRFEASRNMDMGGAVGDTSLGRYNTLLEEDPSLTLNPSVQIQEEMFSSSQSLYSFLHTSDGNMDQDVEDVENIETREMVLGRPLLGEPFWNKDVEISETLMKTYQMEEEDRDLVLRRDREKLERMKGTEQTLPL